MYNTERQHIARRAAQAAARRQNARQRQAIKDRGYRGFVNNFNGAVGCVNHNRSA